MLLCALEGPHEGGGGVLLDHVGVGLLALGALPLLHQVVVHLRGALQHTGHTDSP